jgi:Phosphotransferase enzyme family
MLPLSQQHWSFISGFFDVDVSDGSLLKSSPGADVYLLKGECGCIARIERAGTVGLSESVANFVDRIPWVGTTLHPKYVAGSTGYAYLVPNSPYVVTLCEYIPGQTFDALDERQYRLASDYVVNLIEQSRRTNWSDLELPSIVHRLEEGLSVAGMWLPRAVGMPELQPFLSSENWTLLALLDGEWGVHGDLNSNNFVWGPHGELKAVIDFASISVGGVLAEVVPFITGTMGTDGTLDVRRVVRVLGDVRRRVSAASIPSDELISVLGLVALAFFGISNGTYSGANQKVVVRDAIRASTLLRYRSELESAIA